MKKLPLIILILIVTAWGAYAQKNPIPSLFWVGCDFGWNGRTFGGGANIDAGFLLAKSLYVDLVGSFFLSDNTSVLFGAGTKYHPSGNGLMAGLDFGVGDIQKDNVDDWCFASVAEAGYAFGWILLGTKVSVYFTSGVQATLGLFVDFT